MATEFASVYMWPVSGFNMIVAGFRDRVTPDELRFRLEGAPSQLVGVAADALDHAKPVAPIDDPLTDDRAPVEWMTDQMIVRYAADGGTGR